MKRELERYRDHAEECRRLANIATDELRAGYMDLAKSYDTLADQTEAIGRKRAPPWTVGRLQ